MLILSQYHIFESYKINIYSADSPEANTVLRSLNIPYWLDFSEFKLNC
jgi:hypothetical protein